MRIEDDVFNGWHDAEGEERQKIEGTLFAELVKYASAIICLKSGRPNDELASDVANVVISSLPSFGGKSKFTTWIYAIILNQINLYFRGTIKEEKLFEPLPPEDNDSRFGREYDMITKLSLDQIQRNLELEEGRLFEGLRNGKDQNELAAELGISCEAAQSRRRRTMARAQNKVKGSDGSKRAEATNKI